MAKEPDTRYGGEPPFQSLCGFSLMNEPYANGTIFFTNDNRSIVETDMLAVNSILLSTFNGLVAFPERPMIYVAPDAIISATIDSNAISLESLPRYPLTVAYGNRGMGDDFDPNAWEWEYARSKKKVRGTMVGYLYESGDPIGFTSHAKIKYLKNGNPGWVDYTTWRIPDLGYERFDMAFRIKNGGLALTRIDYRSDPNVNSETIYKLGKDGPAINTVAEHKWVERPRGNQIQEGQRKRGFLGRLIERFKS